MLRHDLVDGAAQPGGRAPAPDGLRLVQDLVNTVDRENGVELLDGPAGLREWLAFRALAGRARVGGDDVRHALELREALRVLLLPTGGHEATVLDRVAPGHSRMSAPDGGMDAARDVLERVAVRGDLRAVFASDGSAGLRPAGSGVDGALARVVAAAHAAMTDGGWARLKACPRDVCGWAFYDRSPNNGATWCSMRVCGNRTKVAAFRRRHVQD